MQYLHTMIRITDIDTSLRFYCDGLGLQEVRRYESEAGRFTLIFLASASASVVLPAPGKPIISKIFIFKFRFI